MVLIILKWVGVILGIITASFLFSLLMGKFISVGMGDYEIVSEEEEDYYKNKH